MKNQLNRRIEKLASRFRPAGIREFTLEELCREHWLWTSVDSSQWSRANSRSSDNSLKRSNGRTPSALASGREAPAQASKTVADNAP